MKAFPLIIPFSTSSRRRRADERSVASASSFRRVGSVIIPKTRRSIEASCGMVVSWVVAEVGCRLSAAAGRKRATARRRQRLSAVRSLSCSLPCCRTPLPPPFASSSTKAKQRRWPASCHTHAPKGGQRIAQGPLIQALAAHDRMNACSAAIETESPPTAQID